MKLLTPRRADAAEQRGRELQVRFGRELRIARLAAGLSQREVAHRARTSQPMVSLVERGRCGVAVRAMSRLARAVGHDLSLRLYPADGVTLRDSGQLKVAVQIRASAHETWRVSMEEPIAPAPDRRAADVVLRRGDVVLHIEIERAVVDLQAQLRAAQLKRAALAALSEVPVRLLLAVPDTLARRRSVAPAAELIRAALPIASREAWRAIRIGADPGGDALLWVANAR